MTPSSKPTVQRQTRQRTAVSELLDGLDEFKSAQELHDILRHRGEPIGLTTVYRSLQTLAESGTSTVRRANPAGCYGDGRTT